MRMRVPVTQFLRVCVCVWPKIWEQKGCVCDSIFACVDDPNTYIVSIVDFVTLNCNVAVSGKSSASML